MNNKTIVIIAVLLIGMANCHKPDEPNGGENGGNGGNGNNGGGDVTNIVPENAIAGKFSINQNEQVFFSKGNLLYSESTHTWSFADHQYEYFGTTSSSAFCEWIDLFDWNTNGAEHGGLSAWRPLTHQEWVYILDERSTLSGKRFAKGKVAGNNGLIILPDDWNVESVELNGVNSRNASFYSNSFDIETWGNTFEANGAVFLPAAGWATSSSQNSGTVGAYWSATQQYPIVFNNTDLQSSYVSLQEVSPFSKFSVRLVYSDGQGGGNESLVTSPIVETGEICSIGRISAKCGFTILTNENNFGVQKGVYCGTTENPTSDAPIHAFTNMSGDYNGEWDGVWMSGLTPNTTYYVRAYAKTTDNNITYGEQKSFTTLPDYPCYINGEFSVSEDCQVYFSKGNLQFQASTYTWRFAENQWDYVGTEIPDLNGDFGGTVPGSSNHLISTDYSGWIDLFAWGSAINPTLVEYMNITDFVDWGTKPISNAGGHAYPWRTLTDEEWDYLLYERQTPSRIRFTKGIVNDVRGLILLPDDWSASVYQLNNINNAGVYTGNIISETIWKDVLEAHGAVFLPCAGKRVMYDVSSVGRRGYYWLTKRGWYLDFLDSNFPYTYNPYNSYYGFSVRLVWCVQDEFK